MRFALTVLLTLACGGCFTTRLSSVVVGNTAGTGVVYRLPAKQFGLTATYEITGCVAKGAVAELTAKATASLSEHLIADPSQAYALDYEELSAWTKVTDAAINLSESGLLTGINVSMTDQSGAILQDTVSAVTSVTKAVALGDSPLNTALLKEVLPSAPQATGAGDAQKIAAQVPLYERRQLMAGASGAAREAIKRIQEEAIDPCKSVATARADLEQARAGHKMATEASQELSVLKVEQARLEAMVAALQGDLKAYKEFGTPQLYDNAAALLSIKQARKNEVLQRIAQIADPKLEKAASKLAEAQSVLVFNVRADFIPGAGRTSKTVTPDPVELRKLFGEASKAKITLPKLAIELRLVDGAQPTAAPLPKSGGVVYRVPAPAFVQVKNADEILLDHLTTVPQFGSIGTLDLDNGAFDNNNISAAFNASGGLAKLVFNAASKGAAASGAVRGAATTYLTAEQEKQAALVQAYKTRLELETGALSLRTQKLGLGEREVETQVAVIKSQLEALKELQRLEAARTGTATADEVRLNALTTQKQLLEKQLEIEKLEAELEALRAQQPAE